MPARDYYVVLGVSRHESPRGIQAAYHQLARQLHPDLTGTPDATAFQELNEAYSVLSDAERRKNYDHATDRGVEIPVRRGVPVEPLAPEPISLFGNAAGTHPSFDAFVERYLRNFSGVHVPKSEHAESLTLDVVLSPAEAASGCALPIGVPGFYACPECGGTGHIWMFPCTDCRGSGFQEQMRTMWVSVPAGARPGAILEYPLDHLGVRNLYLRVHISISDQF